VIVTRNHNARVRPNVFRWQEPDDYMSGWSLQRSLISGALAGVLSGSIHHIWKPVTDILHFYQAPDNLKQLGTFTSEVLKHEAFRSGYLGTLGMHLAYGLSFHGARLFLWHTIAGGYSY
jgi:hypothetical protein